MNKNKAIDLKSVALFLFYVMVYRERLREINETYINIWPTSSWKMTVGQELATLTGLKLFHNHMTIDLVSPIFDYSTKEAKRLVSLFRNEIFEEVSKSDLSGMIFTYIWAFDLQADWDYIHHVESILNQKVGQCIL